jgi:hypothetical protein
MLNKEKRKREMKYGSKWGEMNTRQLLRFRILNRKDLDPGQ